MRKWLENNIMSSITLAGLIGVAVYYGDVKQLLFSNAGIKYKTESHVENTDDLTVFKNRQRDSIANAKHMAFQDSIDRVRDTLTKRNAVTTYQNKQKIDSALKILERMNKNIEHALEHVDP